jgi:hypothetical protein
LDNDEAGIRALDRICQQLLNENTVSLPHWLHCFQIPLKYTYDEE